MAIRILSVDDEMDMEILLSQYFRRQIRRGDYEFSFAHNGVEALEMIVREGNFDIILSDINMPEMDGLTLLTKVNEMRNPAMKCIMVSAYGDMRNIRSAMNNGAFDFATKPIDLDDLSRTIEKAVEQIDYVKRSQEEHKQLESIKADLAAAHEIQQAIVPHVPEPGGAHPFSAFSVFPDLPEEISIAAMMTPAKDVGGDFYDFFKIDDEHFGLVMADVSGKGLPAALFMAVARTLVHSIGMTGCTVTECMERVNTLLCSGNERAMFVTVFYGILDIKTGELRYTNAGHTPPVILRRGGKIDVVRTQPDIALAILDCIPFREKVLNINSGDTLLLYTDGVTEANNAAHKMFREEGLIAALPKDNGAHAHSVLDNINAALADFVKEAPQSDDITIMAVSRK